MPVRDWAQLRKVLRNGDSFNREVYDWFKDADSNNTRKALRDDLLIGAKDSIAIAQVKMRAFREIIQKTHLKPDIIGMPKIDVDADVTYKPEVTLFFKQNKESVPKGKTAKTARMSYRLMNQTSSSLSKAELRTLGQNIYNDFAKPTPYRFNKGKIIGWYVKPEDGLNLQIYAHTSEIGETVARKIIAHRNLTFDDNIFKFTTPNRNSDTTPGTITILGETQQKPIWRPTVFVEFEHASINLHNDTQIRVLCDLSGTYANPMYRP
ncbi:hypothetical protein H6G33_04225 [Calothrix sp. FACHB-1219]|uniref:hypothetical protein n=1 Tax=unclassified Calothrix TaxID=2619626 RepID=UPI0016856C0A|nr:MULTISPECIES: hypothetical protein [unclassified Calothrix]MBD2204940.1 hypothetical protein [Calothrix sp. FACHB-168]MBD2216235.1 hypothetical protein [Calothrix sp. FACHB-1219]